MNPAKNKKKGDKIIQTMMKKLDNFHFAILDQELAGSLIETISNYIPIILDYFPQPSYISSALMFLLKLVMSKLYEFKNIYEGESLDENWVFQQLESWKCSFKDKLEELKLNNYSYLYIL